MHYCVATFASLVVFEAVHPCHCTDVCRFLAIIALLCEYYTTLYEYYVKPVSLDGSSESHALRYSFPTQNIYMYSQDSNLQPYPGVL